MRKTRSTHKTRKTALMERLPRLSWPARSHSTWCRIPSARLRWERSWLAILAMQGNSRLMLAQTRVADSRGESETVMVNALANRFSVLADNRAHHPVVQAVRINRWLAIS